jgi:predicted GH43/DUF377 family glycosyl hydrolase
MAVRRLDANPLLTPDDVPPTREDREVICTLNPAAVPFGDQTLLLVRVGERPVQEPGYVSCLHYDAEAGEERVERIAVDDPDLVTADPRGSFYRGRMLLNTISHLRVARSGDGAHFRFDPQPAIAPSTPYESYGCEDPRITFIDGHYYVAYTAVSEMGVAVAVAETDDFRTFAKFDHVIFPPYQKDVAIFPEKRRGMYVCRHRPYKTIFNPASIWTAYSPDLFCWGRHEMTLAPVPGTWQGGRVGCGATPLRTDEGWLEVYHAADAGDRYCLGAMLSDLEFPERVVARSTRPILQPEAEYEQAGVYANCVFSNGLIAGDDGTLTIYYGAADRVCAAAVTTVDEMIAAAKQ